MTTTPAIDYTNQDYSTILAALQANIRARFPNTWKDFTESSIGTCLMELVAFTFDSLSFMIDTYCNEQFLPTAKDRESVILLCRLIGYNLRPATSASVLLTATLPSIQTYDTVIPAHTEISSVTGVKFESLTDQTIPAGHLTADLTFVQGLTVTDEFTSDGTAFQEFKLSSTPLIDGSLSVTVDGFAWDEVESLVYSSGVDQSYSVRTDVDDYGYVKFGDGTSGQIPTKNATISCSYRIGGGVVGNVPIGDIDVSVPGNLSGTMPIQTVDVALYNNERGSGGEEKETIDHAKFWAPKSVVANGRAVTESDFDTLASTFKDPIYGAPSHAKAQLHQNVPESNLVDLYLWARNELGNIVPPSEGLKNAVSAYFNNNGTGAVRIITVDVDVLDGNIVYLDLDVGVVPNGLLSNSETLTNVNYALTALLNNPSNQPGTAVRMSKLYSTIQASSGVEHSLVRLVTATYKKTELIGLSDGHTTQFDYTTQQVPRPSSITIKADTLVITDNGDGRLIGDVDPTAENTVDYATGDLNFTLREAVPLNAEIKIEYRYPLQYLRNETDIATTNGITRTFTGKLTYPPLIKNTVAFTDGVQVVTDDGHGRLVGNKDDTKVAVIDYETGAYEFTFTNAPSAETSIATNYTQLLSVVAGDIPVEKNQLVVPGTFIVDLLSD
jgi:hypothetical protein